MSRVVAYFVASIALLALGFSFQNTTIGDITTGGFLALVTPAILAVSDEKVAIRMRWYSMRYRSEMVRISAAYLFRIKIDGKYLLVKGFDFLTISLSVGCSRCHPKAEVSWLVSAPRTMI